MWEKSTNKKMSVLPGKLFHKLGLALLYVILISGCTTLYDPETSQEFNKDICGTITSTRNMGQTFISRRERLNGITLWFETEEPGIDLTLNLYHTPLDRHPIFSTTIKVTTGSNYIAFPAQIDPPNQLYYIELGNTSAKIYVLGRDEDVYPHGNAYLNNQPIEGDLAFQTTYEYDVNAVISDFQEIINQSWLVFPLAILLIFPGWLIIYFSGLRKDYDLGERIAMSIGLSTALIPILMLWTTTLGLSWNRFVVRASAVILLLIFIFTIALDLNRRGIRIIWETFCLKSYIKTLILILIFAGTFFIRFAMIRDLAAPAWVDPVHHSLITNKILENGGYPTNYLPHIPIEAIHYHPGFHSLLASFHWMTDISISESMLILGQVMNALMVFPVYLLGTTLTKDKNAGLVTALITGLLFLMPAYYTSWGRYTQLAGLLVLPAGIQWISRFQKIPKKYSEIIIGGIIVAGLTLLHYRVLFFLLCLIIALWIGYLYRPDLHFPSRTAKSLASTGIFGISGLIIGLPWIIPAMKTFLASSPLRGGVTPQLSGIHWTYFTPVYGIPIIVLAGIGLILGIFKKRRFSITILLWGLLLFVIANPGYFHLPFPAYFVNLTSVEIMLFMPIAVLAGYLISQGFVVTKQWIPNHQIWIYTTIVILIGIIISFMGAQKLLSSLNPSTYLFRKADKSAIEWIKNNIPEDEIIVINPTGWGYGLYMGNDGGFWISPLTNHATIPPNVLYGMNKTDYQITNQFVEELLPIGEDADQIYKLLKEHGFRYIYIGQKGGVLSPQTLNESPNFKLHYHKENTWVFEAIPKP